MRVPDKLAGAIGAIVVACIYALGGVIMYFIALFLTLHDEGLRVAIIQILFGPVAALLLSLCASMIWPRLYLLWGFSYGAVTLVLVALSVMGRYSSQPIAAAIHWSLAFALIYGASVVGGLVGRRCSTRARSWTVVKANRGTEL